MAMISPRDLYLRQHPELAARLDNPRELRKFLNNHGGIASGWQRVMAATSPTLQDPRTPAAAAPAAADAAAPGPADAGTPSASADPGLASARASIQSTLARYGLGGLAEWAWGQYVNGVPSEQIMLDMRDRPEYQQRFPGMAELSRKGQAIDEATYINAERSYAEQMRAAGLPQGFYDDPTDFGRLIAGNVGAQEFGDRLQMAQQTAMTDPRGQRLRDELSRLYGIPNAVGMVTAYWIDPDRSAALLRQQIVAGQIASESAVTGFGSLTAAQAERIGGTGVSAGDANQAFAGLAGLGELRTGLVGDSGSQGINQDTMIDATFTGDAAAQRKLKDEQSRRIGRFQGGGGFATGQGGVSGLGSAAD